MSSTVLEIEGTAEEIQERLNQFAGQRLFVTIQASVEPPGVHGSVDAALEEIWRDVPVEAWESLPTDFADHIDHYLYGIAKDQ